MIRTDNHMHTEFDHDCDIETGKFVKSAIAKGMRNISFTMHSPCPKAIKTLLWEDKIEDIEAYKNKIPLLQKEFPRIRIGFGIEIDYVEGCEDEISDFTKRYNFDYVLGSVHLIGRWPFDFDEKVFTDGLRKINIEDAYKEYYRLLRQLAKLEVDALAHFDLIKKFNHNSRFFSQETEDYREQVEKTLDAVKKKDLVLEVNTAGIYKPVKEIYPSEWILKQCFERKIELAIGSDSHSPEQIGRSFNEAEKILKKIGFGKLAIFKRRKKEYIKL